MYVCFITFRPASYTDSLVAPFVCVGGRYVRRGRRFKLLVAAADVASVNEMMQISRTAAHIGIPCVFVSSAEGRPLLPPNALT